VDEPNGHVHLEVSLTVSCPNPADVPVVSEKLARVMAGLALDGHDARLNVWRFECADEDEDVIP
jgi:hypothetical protein